jgi:hypothetical protein
MCRLISKSSYIVLHFMNKNAPPVHASFVGSGEDSGVNLRGRPTGFAGGRVAEGLVLLPRGRKLNDGRRSSLSVSRDQSMPQQARADEQRQRTRGR